MLTAAFATLAFVANPAEARERWTETQANGWYARQPWLVGSNYTPASAINQLVGHGEDRHDHAAERDRLPRDRQG